jgi:hypothetical protein
MLNSFEEFKTAVYSSLRDKVSERIDTEREYISNDLLRVEAPADAEETQSNTDEN